MLQGSVQRSRPAAHHTELADPGGLLIAHERKRDGCAVASDRLLSYAHMIPNQVGVAGTCHRSAGSCATCLEAARRARIGCEDRT